MLAWDFAGPFDAVRAPWPTLSGNYFRTGLAGAWDNVPIVVSEIALVPAGPGRADVAWRVGDPVLAAWSLERRLRLQSGAPWGPSQTLTAGLRPDLNGWCRWLDADLPLVGEAEWSARAAVAPGDTLTVRLGSLPLTPPARDRLLGAHPNPFNPSTTIRFEISAATPVRLDIYDVRGRRLRELQNGMLPAGAHAIDWDGRDGDGRRLPSGLYLARFSQSGSAESCRLLLLK